MDWSNLTWMLTGLAAVLVLLTRVRLSVHGERAAGVAEISGALLTWHTAVGVVALVVWIAALATSSTSIAALGLLAWWILTAVGLLLLARWIPSGGKHADEKASDEWGAAGLSILGHVGMLAGALYFTFVVLTDRL
jgi:hypothetical protein